MAKPKICTKCGNEFPATTEYFYANRSNSSGLNSLCRTCDKQRVLERYHADPLNKEKQRERRSANPEQHRTYKRRYEEKHEGKEKERKSQQYWGNHNENKLKARQRYRDSKVNLAIKFRPYPREDSVEQRVKTHYRDAYRLNLPATLTCEDWNACVVYWNNRCAVCGRPQGLWHFLAQDHWIPSTKGGGYTPDNILPLCHGLDGCNNSKGNRNPEEWLIEKLGKRKAKTKLREIQAYFDSVK